MSVAWSDEYLDMNDTDIFTNNGSASMVASDWAGSMFVDLDGIDDYLSSSVQPLTDGKTQMTMQYWCQVNTVEASMRYVVQEGAGTQWGAMMYTGGTTLFAQYNQTSGIHTDSGVAATQSWADGDLHLVGSMVSVAGASTDIKIVTDGVEVAYSHQNADKSGGVTTFNGYTNVSVGSNNAGDGNFLHALVGRLKFADVDKATEAEMLEDYLLELSLQASGGNSILRQNRNISLNGGSNLNTGTNLNTGLNLV